MAQNEVLAKIITHLTSVLKEKIGKVEKDTALVASGLMDSLELLSLIEHIETAFGVKLGDADLVPANFETPELVATLVTRLKGVK